MTSSKSPKIEAERVGEYVDWVKFYLKISEEISFTRENIIFNDAVSRDGVKW